MRRLTLAILGILCFASNANAATYYMCGTGTTCGAGWSNGSDSNAGTSKSVPVATLVGAFGKMSGGDTLMVGNGTYTGNDNCIWGISGHYPPAGSAGAYTTVRAENDGEAVFDGEAARAIFNVNPSPALDAYWQLEGMIWKNTVVDGFTSVVNLANITHIKFLRCGAYDPGAGNTATFGTGTGVSYILYEGCYAYGKGRYKFAAYSSNYIIYRNCVARHDLVDTSTSHNPSAGFSIYSTNHVKVQNCIVVDSDQTTTQYLTNQFGGCYAVYTTSATADDIEFTNSVCLNSTIGGLFVAANYAATNIDFNNMVFWDIRPQTAPYDPYYRMPALWSRAISGSFTNLTVGAISDTDSTNNAFLGDTGGTSNLYSSIFASNVLDSSSVALLYNLTAWDYNDYYNNTAAVTTHAHDITTNPFTNSLLYLPRIESGSSLSGQGQSGADIGANLIYQQGASGTLWGDSGYATQQSTLMWPFPNEALIKSKFAAYSSGGVSGARGFATGTSRDGSVQTLTKYIWEYLGNQIPANVYSDTTAPTLSVSQGSTVTVRKTRTTTLTGTCSDAVGVSWAKWRAGAAPDGSNGTACTGSTSWSCDITGLGGGSNDIRIGCADAAGNVGTATVNVEVTKRTWFH